VDGESHSFTLLRPFLLERGSRPDGGIKCQVIGFPIRRASLYIAPAFTVGVGARAPSSPFAVQLVQIGIQITRPEGFTDFDLLAPIPPIGIAYVEDTLPGRLTLVLTPLVLLRGEV
jgi:hypothetical protein